MEMIHKKGKTDLKYSKGFPNSTSIVVLLLRVTVQAGYVCDQMEGHPNTPGTSKHHTPALPSGLYSAPLPPSYFINSTVFLKALPLSITSFPLHQPTQDPLHHLVAWGETCPFIAVVSSSISGSVPCSAQSMEPS